MARTQPVEPESDKVLQLSRIMSHRLHARLQLKEQFPSVSDIWRLLRRCLLINCAASWSSSTEDAHHLGLKLPFRSALHLQK